MQNLAADYRNTHFDLRNHLESFLAIDAETLDQRMAAAQSKLKELGEKEFSWEQPELFYSDAVIHEYLYDLSAWHESSADYIGDTISLIAEKAVGKVLDFGGGIGTHSIAASYVASTSQVDYVDTNPANRAFVSHRAKQLGLNKLNVGEKPDQQEYSTILCLDVLEHLGDPAAQLKEFFGLLSPDGILICNWYFFQGFDNQFPFHLTDPSLVQSFFLSLQLNFLEQFHPYLMTTRCYRPHPHRLENGKLRWQNPSSF